MKTVRQWLTTLGHACGMGPPEGTPGVKLTQEEHAGPSPLRVAEDQNNAGLIESNKFSILSLDRADATPTCSGPAPAIVEEAIRSGQFARACRMIDLESRVAQGDHQSMDALLRRVLELDKESQGAFAGVIDAVVDALLECESDPYPTAWQHTACHAIESFGYGPERWQESLLDSSNPGAAVRLANDGIRRAIEETSFSLARRLGCLPRMLEPIAKYNLAQIDPDRLDHPFALRPERMDDPRFISLLERKPPDGDYERLMLLFAQAKTPQILLRQVIEEKLKLNINDVGINVAIVRAAQSLVPADVLQSYVEEQMRYSVQASDMAADFACAEEAAEILNGLFVDVDGTLVRDEQITGKVLNAMQYAQRCGMPVHVFSGGDSQRQTSRLVALGLDSAFLPVKPKSDFKGKVLANVLDDTRSDIQGFKAGKYFHPGNSKLPGHIDSDGETTLLATFNTDP